MGNYGTDIAKDLEPSRTSPSRLYLLRSVTISSRWIRLGEESCLDAFPAPAPRAAEVLAARQVPRAPWRHDDTWVRCYRPVGQQYRHRPADSESLPLLLGTLASKGHTAAPQAQAPGAVASYAGCWSPA